MISQKAMQAQLIKVGATVTWADEVDWGSWMEQTGTVLRWRQGRFYSEWLIELPDGTRRWVTEWALRGSIMAGVEPRG